MLEKQGTVIGNITSRSFYVIFHIFISRITKLTKMMYIIELFL